MYKNYIGVINIIFFISLESNKILTINILKSFSLCTKKSICINCVKKNLHIHVIPYNNRKPKISENVIQTFNILEEKKLLHYLPLLFRSLLAFSIPMTFRLLTFWQKKIPCTTCLFSSVPFWPFALFYLHLRRSLIGQWLLPCEYIFFIDPVVVLSI